MIRAAAVALVLAACGGTAPTPSAPETHTITGTFALAARDGAGFSGACKGTGGYSDIAGGMPMTLRDEDGTVLAATRLATGQASEDRNQCVFEFTFEDVPVAEFYSIEGGDRGELTYSFDEMESMGWRVGFALGS